MQMFADVLRYARASQISERRKLILKRRWISCAKPLWSAVTCHRFNSAATCRSSTMRQQAAADQSGDRSPHSKEMNYDHELQIAMALAREAGAAILSLYKEPLDVQQKSYAD